MLSTVVLSCVISSVLWTSQAELSASYRQFLQSTYGSGTESELNRADLGAVGSFGGGNHIARQKTNHRAVILVHGITNTAGTFYRIKTHFHENGYGEEEVYATTYGDGGKTNVLFVTMNCHYMKVVRMMIVSVAEFTGQTVNVIGYSMGSPVARKAIMGGTCVDTGEDLGPPLSGLVHTFIGVAGANFGSALCVIPVGSCNMINGLNCFSRFINDINARSRYEGNNVFTIYSTNDDKVGYQACGKIASAIPGENQAFQKSGMNHDQVIFDTAALQFNLNAYQRP